MNDTLQTTLNQLIQADSKSNVAFNTLHNDYVVYHTVLLVVGGVFASLLVLLSVFCWRRFRRAPKTNSHKWAFEKKTYFSFGILSVVLSLLMTLIVVANASNVVSPQQGLLGSVNMLGEPKVGTQTYKLQREVNAWLVAGNGSIPVTLKTKIDERLAWQRPKAIICSILLLLSVLATAHTWRKLIRNSRAHTTKWKLKEIARLFLGILLVVVCILLMLMVIGNIQASFAPLMITLMYG